MREPGRLREWGPWVISLLALFVALSGTAVALKGKNTVGSDDIKPGAVKSQDIAPGAVKGTNVADGTVTSEKIAEKTIANQNLGNGSVRKPNLANNSVQARNLNTLQVEYGDTFVALTTDGNRMTATCPDGTRMISGGGNTTGNGVIVASYPDVTLPGKNPQKWIVDARALGGGASFGGAYALCLE